MTLTISVAGGSKTQLAIHEAVAVATGKTWAGQVVFDPGPIVYIGGEDDRDEIDRRVFAAASHMGADLAQVRARFFRHATCDRALNFARVNERGVFMRDPDVDLLIAQILCIGARLVIFDPLVELHQVNENDNGLMRHVGAIFRQIAQRGRCAVHLIHHTRKAFGASSNGFVGEMDAARGASSMVGVARIVHTLLTASKDDLRRYGIPAEDRRTYVRLDGAKANFSAIEPSPIWFQRVGATIKNGEEVGVLEPVGLTAGAEEADADRRERHRSIIARLLVIVTERMSINQAGLALIAQPETLFPNYARKELDGRCPPPVGREIEEAVASGVQVNGEGFLVASNEGGARGANTRTKVLMRCNAS